MDTKIRLFCDMDGTFAEWRDVKKFDELLQKGFFRKMKPQLEVILAVVYLNLNYGNVIEPFSLSAFPIESLYACAEKNEWLDFFGLDEAIPSERRIFCPCNTDKSLYVPDGIRPTDVLLDDYSFNLREWKGRGLKLLNGINATKGTWTGATVSKDIPYKDLAIKILEFCTRPLAA